MLTLNMAQALSGSWARGARAAPRTYTYLALFRNMTSGQTELPASKVAAIPDTI